MLFRILKRIGTVNGRRRKERSNFSSLISRFRKIIHRNYRLKTLIIKNVDVRNSSDFMNIVLFLLLVEIPELDLRDVKFNHNENCMIVWRELMWTLCRDTKRAGMPRVYFSIREFNSEFKSVIDILSDCGFDIIYSA